MKRPRQPASLPADYPPDLGRCQYCGQPGSVFYGTADSLLPAHFACHRRQFPEHYRTDEQIAAEEFTRFFPTI